jgi:DNA replication and repair protein RecF
MFSSVVINNLRNIDEIRIEPSSRLNVFWGKNGAGKTSCLEAISLLTHGRSFRTTSKRSLVMKGRSLAAVKGQTALEDGLNIQLWIDQDGVQKVLFGNDKVESSIEMARRSFCLSIYNPSDNLFNTGSEGRRNLIDWMVFYMQPRVSQKKTLYELAKRQSSELLKQGKLRDLGPWMQQMANFGEEINASRYFAFLELERELKSLSSIFSFLNNISISWYQGWSNNETLFHSLESTAQESLKRGFFAVGAHRADIRMRYQTMRVAEILSKGYVKALSLCMYISAYHVVSRHLDVQGVMLVDDLSSELHLDYIESVLQLLERSKSQVFISDIARYSQTAEYSMFHVEHGGILT